MSLAELRLADVRCLPAAELLLHPRHNLISGANGAGKTSLLEAIYLLGRGRSFRTRYTEQLVRASATRLWVAGRVASSTPESETAAGARRERRIDLQYDRRDGVAARLDAQPVASLTALSEALPVQVIDPSIHRLIEEGPAPRRRWLDWAVFHVEPGFVAHWQDYMRALRQRNAALQAAADPRPWEEALARLGEDLTASRRRLIQALQPLWAQTLGALAAAPATLDFYGGWSHELALPAALARHREGDRERGSTRYGPHRFDVLLRIDGRAAREVISRGQQKLLGAAMTLSVARYLAQTNGQVPTLLLDDPAAELDDHHTAALLSTVAALGGQWIATALRPAEPSRAVPDRVFHVEHGGVKRL